MAIRFRKSVKIAPGLKLNIGKGSASVRVGGKHAGYTVGTSGHGASASLPGTGLSANVRRRHKRSSAVGLVLFLAALILVVGAALVLFLAWPK